MPAFTFQNANDCGIILTMEPQIENRLPNVESVASKQVEVGFNFDDNAKNSNEIFKNKYNLENSLESIDDVMEIAQNALPKVQPAVTNTDLGITQDDLPNDNSITTPATASDADLMEKEWVDKLKGMIIETRNDPFLRQKKFKDMQMDYLKKRYNRIINGGK